MGGAGIICISYLYSSHSHYHNIILYQLHNISLRKLSEACWITFKHFPQVPLLGLLEVRLQSSPLRAGCQGRCHSQTKDVCSTRQHRQQVNSPVRTSVVQDNTGSNEQPCRLGSYRGYPVCISGAGPGPVGRTGDPGGRLGGATRARGRPGRRRGR